MIPTEKTGLFLKQNRISAPKDGQIVTSFGTFDASKSIEDLCDKMDKKTRYLARGSNLKVELGDPKDSTPKALQGITLVHSHEGVATGKLSSTNDGFRFLPCNARAVNNDIDPVAYRLTKYPCNN